MESLTNPFRHNYVFGKKDVMRDHVKMPWYSIFYTTYIQLNDGYIFYYKIIGHRIYLMSFEKFNP